MSDKDSNWSDYWKKYKPKTSPKTSPKTPKSGKKLSLPKVNKQLVFIAVSIIVILILGLLNFRSGNYAKVLETDITELENQMISYEDESEEFSSMLNTCKADLAICNTNVSSKVVALEKCEGEMEDTSPTLCQERYVKVKENYIHYKCCQVDGVYKSYNIGNDMEIICRTDTNGIFELEC